MEKLHYQKTLMLILIFFVLAIGEFAIAQTEAEATEKAIPIETFIQLFKEKPTTLAMKQFENHIFEGWISVSDVRYPDAWIYGVDVDFKAMKEKVIEVDSWDAKEIHMRFHTNDKKIALTIRVGDKVLIRGKLAGYGTRESGYINVPNTHYAIFNDAEILEIDKQSKETQK